MINIIKQEIPIDESLKKKLEFICDFCNTTPTFINGSIRKIDKSNLAYVEPHKVIINNIMFLVFNYSNNVYIKNFGNRIKINELKEENNSLFAELNYFKNKFIRLIKFIKNRLFNRKDRDKYHDFSRDLYEHGVIEHDTIKELNETYKFSKEHDLSKEKDDYDIEI